MIFERSLGVAALALFTVALITMTVARAEPPENRFAKWEKEISALEAKAAKSPPAPGGVVFLGSSSIRLWNLAESFPELPAVNHGFGGSQLFEATHFVPRLVTPFKPRLVVLYEGDNDLNSGKTPEQFAADFEEFVKVFQAAVPDCKLLVLAIKPSPSRWKLFERQTEANKRVQAIVAGGQRMQYVDLVTPMLDASGMVRGELFQADKLHLNAEGYRLWSATLAPYLK